MRQAGRYLPEYRAVRKDIGHFFDLCYQPDVAVALTLQPLERYEFDAAIIFSDILVIADALGQEVKFQEKIGPILTTPLRYEALRAVDDPAFGATLEPIYTAISRLSARLDEEAAVIGFAGAPWTLAYYMMGGGGRDGAYQAKKACFEDPAAVEALLDHLVEAVIWHLGRQIEAGADAVQIFESWAGILDDHFFTAWCVRPVARIVAALRDKISPRTGQRVPIIVFPRNAGIRYLLYVEATGIDGLSLDYTVPLDWARHNLAGKNVVLQGNLDPHALLAGGSVLDRSIDAILTAFSGSPFIFNLGHGVLPATPPDHVAHLVDRVRRQ